MVLAVLVGVSAGGCAPSVQGAGETGGTIRDFQLTLDRPELGPVELPVGTSDKNVLAAADRYCGQFGRSAHITRDETGIETGWPWTDIYHFECLE